MLSGKPARSPDFGNGRRFALIVGTLFAASAACSFAATPATERPNVLFLMTDEQHFRSLSLTGNPYVETPNMDRIGREGALFVNATCVTPYCSPSRASMVTGVYPHRHGIIMNVSPGRSQQAPLSPDAFPTTETTLYGQGYATAFRGKWHLGDLGDFPCYESFAYASKRPRDYAAFLAEKLPASLFAGFQGPGRYQGRPVEMIPAVHKAWAPFHKVSPGVSYIACIGRSVIPPELLPETQITDQVLELIEKNKNGNFMITASWSPPHDLWVIPEPYYSMVDRNKIQLSGTTDLPEWDRKGASKQLGDLVGPEGIREYAAIYFGMVKYMDDQVGRVLHKLDELGLAENTLVIFTSDHGDMVGAHGCVGKSIFSFYDDLVRIPLCIRFPGRIPPGTVVDQPVSQIDFLPTILDYLDQAIPQDIHGRSLRPLIEGKEVAWRDYAFCQRGDRARMLRTDRYKYTFCQKPPVIALYDLKADPHEDHNLAAEPAHADTVRRMHRRLREIMAADGDQVGTQQRSEFNSMFLKAVALARSGRLGDKLHATSSVGGATTGGPFPTEAVPEYLDFNFWLGQAPEVPYCPKRIGWDFRWWLDYSGGQVTDWGVHHTDIALWALGGEETGPAEVEGKGEFPLGREVMLDYLLGKKPVSELPNSFNVAASFDCTMLLPNGNTIQLVSKQNELVLEGDKGKIRVNRGSLTGKPIEEMTDADKKWLEEEVVKLYKGKQPGSHMRNFFECVKDRSQPVSDVFTHTNSVNSCHMANIAMLLGRKVKWDPQKYEFTGDDEANALRSQKQREGWTF